RPGASHASMRPAANARPEPPPARPPAVTPPPTVAMPQPDAPARSTPTTPPAVATTGPAPSPVAQQGDSNTRLGRGPRRAATPATRPESRPAAATRVAFEASLGTILYAPDRKLAIVDGRIVGVGDEIRGARVTEITPDAVMLRDAQGRLRRLALAATR